MSHLPFGEVSVLARGAIQPPWVAAHLYKRDEPQPLWPLFVAFHHINDPKSVYQVSPDEIGVKRITIEITDDDVSDQILHRVPWLESQRRALVKPNPPFSRSCSTAIH